MSGVIAIVGRPNVGKSALFNRLVGRRIAIVHDQPGVTRDRISAEAEWRGRPFTLVDTGGLGLLQGEKADDVIAQAVFEQIRLALEAAHLVLLVVNLQEGLVPLDREVAVRLRAQGKPVLVVANKADNPRLEAGVGEFAALGFDQIFPVSAIHGRGIEPLMNEALRRLPVPSPDSQGVEAELEAGRPAHPAGRRPASGTRKPEPFKLAIVGRPNVGKSSLINALTKSERVIVSPIPGTTRDAVDVPFEVETDGARESWVLIDTAGLRKARRVADSIEFFSVKRAEDSIARCDLAVLVLDAEAGITEQDKKIGDLIVNNRRACVIVVNKWDLVEERIRQVRQQARARRPGRRRPGGGLPAATLAEFGAWVQQRLFFLDYAPVIFASAKSGFHLDRLLEAMRYVAAQWRQQVPTGLLNRTLQDAVARRPPVSAEGRPLKFFYATQVRQAPPTFVLFVNRAEPLSEACQKHLAGALRRAFGYEGCPLVLIARPRPRAVAPVRRPRPE